jgi:carbon monoxide dehydrogenase subunit G
MRRTLPPLLVVLLAGCGLASFARDPGPTRSEDRTIQAVSERLVLGTQGSVGDLGEVRYDPVLPAARSVELSGSGGIAATSPSALTGIDLSGSGELRADGLDVDELTVDLSGSGTITLAGRTGRQTVELDGSGNYRAARLDSTDAEVTVAGSGTADVQVSGTLRAVIEGSGTITHGGGARVDTQIDGSGSVEER